jgi:hypothetical protein
MGKKSLLIVTGVLVALVAVVIWHELGQRARLKTEAAHLREVAYQSVPHSYSETLKVGMTRKKVEG